MLPSALMEKWHSQNKTAVKPRKQKVAKIPKKIHPVEVSEDEDFSEDLTEICTKYRLNLENLLTAAKGLINIAEADPKLKTQLFGDDKFPIFVQVNCIKVPGLHSRILRLALEHSLYKTNSEICLITADVKGIQNKKHEEHLEYYDKLLASKGVRNIKKIMTFHEFRTEYETFEMKRRLVELYDIFLVDARISGKTVGKCGKIFYDKHKVPTAVKLYVSKLKEHVDKTLKKTQLYLHGKGDSFNVQVGNSHMSSKMIVENIIRIVQELDKLFPGGFGNIRSLNLKAPKTINIPIYISFRNSNEVEVAAHEDEKEEFAVTPTEVKKRRKGDNNKQRKSKKIKKN